MLKNVFVKSLSHEKIITENIFRTTYKITIELQKFNVVKMDIVLPTNRRINIEEMKKTG